MVGGSERSDKAGIPRWGRLACRSACIRSRRIYSGRWSLAVWSEATKTNDPLGRATGPFWTRPKTVGTRRGSLGISVLAEPRTPSHYYTSQAPCSLNVGSWTVTVRTCFAGRLSGLMLKKSRVDGKRGEGTFGDNQPRGRLARRAACNGSI